ncbi:porin [Comamonas testosteroni]|uniref:porin n=1 Tax=Comamonas testosteroni TaxID=285 RepID=UPI00265FB240|nr:porin [Comamonas testosteroni]WKL14398.1 porin [Comamonas testosteroni]
MIQLAKHAVICAVLLNVCGAANAQGSVTIYGRLDSGVDSPHSGGSSISRVYSGGSAGSNLGFRGVENLGGGLSAVFRLEQGFYLDAGTLAQGGRAFGREASVGLSDTRLGTVQMGRIPTPYYSVQGNVDAFIREGAGGLLALTRNINATTQRQVLPMGVAARQDNAISYVSPRWDGLEVRGQYSFGEKSVTIGRGYGVSARYQIGGFDLNAGFQRQEGADNIASGKVSALVLGGSYDARFAKFFLGTTVEKNSCSTCTGGIARLPGTSTSEFRLINVGVRVPFGPFTAIAQFTRVNDRTDYTATTGNRDANWIALGGDYDLSKRTRLYFGAARITNKNGSQYVLGTGTAQAPATLVGSANGSSHNIYMGVRHNF